jgi:hypothetical protein
MSRLVVSVLFVAALVVFAHMQGPEPTGRCCPDPGHQTFPSQGEILFCPVRGR